VIATFFVVLAPGPNSLYVLSLALVDSKKNAFLGAMGIFFGDATLMFLSALGATSLLSLFPKLFFYIQLVGAIYLGYIGIRLIIAGLKKYNRTTPAESGLKKGLRITRSPFVKAYYISILNPKASFFFLSFFLQFVDPAYPNKAIPFLVEASIVQIFSLSYLTILILLGLRISGYIKGKARLQGIFIGSIGVVFCAFAILLAPISIKPGLLSRWL